MLSIFRCLIELKTPLHCGGGDDNGFDQPVTRDGFGLYRIPGSSIAGILRAKAMQMGANPALINRAFGYIEHGKSDGKAAGSLIWCKDGLLLDMDGNLAIAKKMQGNNVHPVFSNIYIRDHVRIGLETGAAEESGKFDEEYAPVGCRFVLEVLFDGWGEAIAEDEQRLFLSLCAALRDGAIRFGGKEAEGFGRIKCLQSACRAFTLTDPAELEAWLNLAPFPYNNGELFSSGVGSELALPVASALSQECSNGLSGWLAVNLEASGPLLIGGGTRSALQAGKNTEKSDSNPDSADMLFYMEPYLDYTAKKAQWRRVVPGSSLRGALRQRVFAIANTLFADEGDAQAILDTIFGYVNGGEAQPGKISVLDAPLPDVQPLLVQHVAIDRFTGGALEGALFNEAPIWQAGIQIPLTLHANGLPAHAAAILLHALMDLAEGFLPVGGGKNRGNGVLRLPGLGTDGAFDWAKALQHIDFSISWNGETLNKHGMSGAGTWLARLDTALTQEQKTFREAR